MAALAALWRRAVPLAPAGRRAFGVATALRLMPRPVVKPSAPVHEFLREPDDRDVARLLEKYPGLATAETPEALQDAEMAFMRDMLETEASVPKVVTRVPAKGSKVKMATLTFKAFDFRIMDLYCSFVIQTAATMNVPISGLVRMPTNIRRWTVLRSPHVDKKSREQFEMRTHKRLLSVYNAHEDVVHKFVTYVEMHVPPGVAMRAIRHKHAPAPAPPPDAVPSFRERLRERDLADARAALAALAAAHAAKDAAPTASATA